MFALAQRRLPAGSPGLASFPYVYGAIHAVVDASTVMVVFAAIAVHELRPYDAMLLVSAYDLLAFAGQALPGAIADRMRATRSVVLLGLALTMVSMLTMTLDPILAMIAGGLGNALFHVGGGALSLSVRPGRAAAPGIFVGPGALGLGLGLWVGKQGIVIIAPFAIALTVAFVLAAIIRVPTVSYNRRVTQPKFDHFWLILGLLLISVAIRAFVGSAGSYQLPKETSISFALVIAAFAGKSLGGVISDRLGWIKTSVGALLLSAPLIAFGGSTAAVVVAGMFLFQMTMPVTLVAVAHILPGRPGFAFGLACLLLIAGAFVAFYRPWTAYYSPALFLGLIGASAAAIYIALSRLKPRVQMKFDRSSANTHSPSAVAAPNQLKKVRV